MMRITHPPFDGLRARNVAAVAVATALLLAGACQEPQAETADSQAPTTRAAPDLDPRATLALDEIQPPPPPPQADHEPIPPPEATTERLNLARALEFESRYTEAALDLERALADDDESAVLRSSLARLYALAGARERARAHGRRALELQPANGIAHYAMGMLLVTDGDAAEAIREFRIALCCPDVRDRPARKALVHYRLALLLEGEGYLSAALEQHRQYEAELAGIDDDFVDNPELFKLVRVNGRTAAEPIARVSERLGRYDEAAEALAVLLSGAGADDSAIRGRYARMLARAGRIDEALEQARIIQDDNRLRVALLLEIHDRAGQPERAVADLEHLCEQHPDDAALAEALADAYANAERWQDAESVLRQFADAHPDAPEASWMVYDFLVRRARWSDALDAAAEWLERKLDGFPAARARMSRLAMHPAAVADVLNAANTTSAAAARDYLVGCVAVDAGRFANARMLLERSLAAAPDFAGPMIELGRMLLRQHRWHDAIAFAAAKDDPHPQLERILGDAYAGLDDAESAIDHYTRAVRLNRSDTSTMRAMAELFERRDEPLRARREYELLLRENPWDANAREALTMLHVQAGERAAAQEQVSTLRRMAAPAQTLARVEARLAFRPQQPDHERFRNRLLAAVGEDPLEPETAYLIASSYISERDFDAAEPYVQRGLDIEPDHQDLLELQVWILRRRLQFPEVEDQLRSIVDRWPNRTLWLNHLLHVLLIQQKHDAITTLARTMLAADALDREDRDRCRVELVNALRALGRVDEAVELAAEWREAEPKNGTLRRLMVNTLLREGRDDDALAVVQRWYEESDGQVGREELLEVLAESKRFDRACQWIVEWLRDDPLDEDLHTDLILTLASAGRYEDALELAEANYARTGRRVSYELAALQTYDQAGRHEDATRLIRQWIYRSERGLSTEFPVDLPQARGLLVSQLMAQDKITDAREHLNRWLAGERNPLNKVTYLTLLSECDRRIGRIDQSFESLELAHSLNPLDVNTCNGLGYTWADAGRRLDDAERLIRYAVASEPRNAAYLDSLGWVLYKKGDFAGAVYWLELARGADTSGDPVILDHLGDAQWRTGNAEAAITQWEAAVDSARRIREQNRGDDPSHREVVERTPSKVDAAREGRPPDTAAVGTRPSEDAAGEQG